jgi:hypothetical protein
MKERQAVPPTCTCGYPDYAHVSRWREIGFHEPGPCTEYQPPSPTPSLPASIREALDGMAWARSHRFDTRALPLADRHYNRRKVGSPQFVPPGRCFVLLTPAADALWVTSWPFAQYVRHAWAGAWVNSLFRNESPALSSELIVQAVAATRYQWPAVPPLGMVTFVDAKKTRRKRDPGRCYLRAGFHRAGMTKGGLHALRLDPADMPAPLAPVGELVLGAA